LRAASHAGGDTTGGVCIAGCPPFRPFSADVVMVLKPPDLGEFPRLDAEARFHSLLIARLLVVR